MILIQPDRGCDARRLSELSSRPRFFSHVYSRISSNILYILYPILFLNFAISETFRFVEEIIVEASTIQANKFLFISCPTRAVGAIKIKFLGTVKCTLLLMKLRSPLVVNDRFRRIRQKANYPELSSDRLNYFSRKIDTVLKSTKVLITVPEKVSALYGVLGERLITFEKGVFTVLKILTNIPNGLDVDELIRLRPLTDVSITREICENNIINEFLILTHRPESPILAGSTARNATELAVCDVLARSWST